MKLDIKKKNKHQIRSLLRLTIRDAAPESYQETRESLENFESSLRIKQGEKRKQCHIKVVRAGSYHSRPENHVKDFEKV